MIEIWDQPKSLCVITSKIIKDQDGDWTDPNNWEEERIIDTVFGWEQAIEEAEKLNEEYDLECFRVIRYSPPTMSKVIGT